MQDEPDPGPVQKLQAAVIEDINLYANRDEETFHPFLPNFAQLVWNLLLKCKPQVRMREKLMRRTRMGRFKRCAATYAAPP